MRSNTFYLWNGEDGSALEALRVDVKVEYRENKENNPANTIGEVAVKTFYFTVEDGEVYKEEWTFSFPSTAMYYWHGGETNRLGQIHAMIREGIYKSIDKHLNTKWMEHGGEAGLDFSHRIYRDYGWMFKIDPYMFDCLIPREGESEEIPF